MPHSLEEYGGDVLGQRRTEADEALIARARHDRAAFAAIYDLYVQRVYAFCLTHSTTREEAEDLTAQTFERALTAMPRYEDHGAPLSSWLFRIAANAAIDRGRRGGRLRILSSDHEAEEQVRRVPMEQSGPDQVVERWEAALWIHTRLAALPSDQRRAVRLRYFEDQGLREIAERMGRSEGAIKQLLHRAVAALRVEMRQEDQADV